MRKRTSRPAPDGDATPSAAGASLAPVPPHVPPELVADVDVHEFRIGLDPIQEWWLELQASHASPIVWTPRNEGHWVALGAEAINLILSDSDRFSSEAVLVPRVRQAPGDTPPVELVPVTLDAPRHAAYRAILNPLLAPGPVRSQEIFIRALANELIDGFADAGRCELMADFARVIPAAVIFRLADLPVSDARRVAQAAERLSRQESGQDASAALGELIDYFGPIIAARRGAPTADAISTIANARVEGRLLTDAEATGMALQLVGAGLDTTASMLGFAMLFLAQNPEQRARLVEDPALIGPATNELIRRFPLAVPARVVRSDMSFFGVQLRRDDMIVAPTPLVNLGMDADADAGDVDFDRPAQPQCTFGNGRHHCPGAVLARLELRILLETWLARIPDFELDSRALRFKNGVTGTIAALPLRWSVSAAPDRKRE